MRTKRAALCAAALLGLGACAIHRPLERTMENGEVLQPRSDDVVARARVDGELERERLAAERDAAAAGALAGCAPSVCAALARGEIALGMSEAQVLAATRTTPEAWGARRSGRVTLLTALPGDRSGPSDATAPVAFVALEDGRVASYTYREPQGLRTVASPADETAAGVAAARADALLRQGDEYAAAGRLDLALERYDRADVILPGDAETTLRIATTLDKALRPVEALIRYQLFLHQLEIEKIQARGEAAARMAEAIALAQQRIVVLERR